MITPTALLARWRTVVHAGLLAALLSRAFSGHAAAHPGDAHAVTSPAVALLILGAAVLAFAGVSVGGLALWLRQRGASRRHARLRTWAGGLLALAAVAAGAAWYVDANSHDPASTAQPYGGTPLDGAAPDFRLTDQRGEHLALSALRGRVVVLAFLDPNCTDICPLTARYFQLVNAQLGQASTDVAFLAVDVNPEANTVDDVARATAKWQVSGVASWHFLTGPTEELQRVWRAYAIEAGNPKVGQPGEVAHSPGVYVIDRRGEKRWYVSVPQQALLGAPWNGPTFDELILQHVLALLEE